MNIKVIKDKTKKLKKDIGVLYLAFKHPKTPWYAKILIGIVVSYALSPIDLIPDFIPILGYIDDLFLIPAGIILSIKLIPKGILLECKEKQDKLSEIRFQGMYASIVIIIIWILLILLLVNIVF